MKKEILIKSKSFITLALRWVSGIFFGLIGVFSIFSDTLSSLPLLLIATILLPPSMNFIQERINFKITRGMKIITIIISFVIFGITANQPQLNEEIQHSSGDTLEPYINNYQTQNIASKVIINEEESASPETIKEKPTIVEDEIITEDKEIVPIKNEILVKEEGPLYKVTSVLDGDTIKISMNGEIETLRLIGIDTPETVDPRKEVQCFGIEATNRAKELLNNQKVAIEYDSSQGERDRFGRLLVYVFLEDGTSFNKKMISEGYAYEYTYNSKYKYQSEFKQAEVNAQSNNTGLWSPDTCNGITEVSEEKEEIIEPKQEEPETQSQEYNFYTSSWHTAKYYYPAECDGWKGLSEKNLRGFVILDDLLDDYTRTLNPNC
jgi:micrococcal nuclease